MSTFLPHFGWLCAEGAISEHEEVNHHHAAPHHMGGKQLDPEKHSGGFLGAMASRVT